MLPDVLHLGTEGEEIGRPGHFHRPIAEIGVDGLAQGALVFRHHGHAAVEQGQAVLQRGRAVAHESPALGVEDDAEAGIGLAVRDAPRGFLYHVNGPALSASPGS